MAVAHSRPKYKKVARRSRKRKSNYKKAGTFRTYCSLAEQKEILKEWATKRISRAALARKFHRNVKTITNIVEQPEVEEEVIKLRKSLVLNTSEAAAERLHNEIEDSRSKLGGPLAFSLLDRLGVLPAKVSKQQYISAVNDEKQLPKEDRERAWVMRLTEMAIETSKAFQIPMPDLLMEGPSSETVIDLKPVGKEKERV